MRQVLVDAVDLQWKIVYWYNLFFFAKVLYVVEWADGYVEECKCCRNAWVFCLGNMSWSVMCKFFFRKSHW